MPLLNNGPPKLWHWQQVIGWIAFEIDQPPVNFNIFCAPLPDKIPERATRKDRAFRALDELVNAVETGAVECVWRDDQPRHPRLSWSQSRERMQGMLDTKLSLDNSIVRNLYFNRETILCRWPRPVCVEGTIATDTKGTIAAEKKCQAWLRKLISSDELSKPAADTGKVRAKKDWLKQAQSQFPGLSERAFDRAWAEVARDNPDMTEPGRKGNMPRKSTR